MPQQIVQSKLYSGGGGGLNPLQVKNTAALLIASTAAVIDVGEHNLVDLWLMNTTAAQGGTLLLGEFSNRTPTVANMTRLSQRSIPASDQTATIDQSVFGLETGTEKAPKEPLRLPVTPNSYLMLALAASAGGVFYARYAMAEGDISAIEQSGASVGSGYTSWHANINAAAAGQTEIQAAPGAGHQLWVYGYVIHSLVVGSYLLQSANTSLSGVCAVGAFGGADPSSDIIEIPVYKCAENEAFNVTMAGAGCTGDGSAWGLDVTL